MKKLLKNVLGILLFSVFVVSVGYSQEVTNFSLERKISFRDNSEKKEIKVEVSENSVFSMEIKSVLTQGEVKVEIYNQKGKKQGNFSVECQVATNDSKERNMFQPIETVTGNYSKRNNTTEGGTWIVKIAPKNAIGNVSIKYSEMRIEKKKATKK